MALLHSWLLPSFCAAVLTHPVWNWRFCWGRLAYLITTRYPALAQCAKSWGLILIALWGFLSYLIIGVNRANSFIGNARTHQSFFYACGTGLQSLVSFDERSDCALIISCCVCGQQLSHMFLNTRGRDTLTLPRKSQMSRSLPDLEGMVFLLACPPPTHPPTATAAAAGGARNSQMVRASLHGSMCTKKKDKKETWIWLHNRK